MATVNWTQSGTFGITPLGYEIVRDRRNGTEVWHVCNTSGQHIGTYLSREDAEAAAR